MSGIERVIQRRNDHVVSDQRPVVDGQSTLILELAAHVDEDVPPDGRVAPEVGVEGREQGDRVVEGPAGQLSQ